MGEDWANVTNVGPSDVPDSCCVTEVEGCGKGVLTGDAQSKERIYTTGCLSTVRQMIASNVVIVGGIAAGVVILQLIASSSSVAWQTGCGSKNNMCDHYSPTSNYSI